MAEPTRPETEVPAALSLYFNFFDSAIQAYIFVTLTLCYVSEAIE